MSAQNKNQRLEESKLSSEVLYHELQDDIRFLGRLLGLSIKESEGESLFGQIEHLRRTAVTISRSAVHQDESAAVDVDEVMTLLIAEIDQKSDQELKLLSRAFSYFMPLTNIAEDRLPRRLDH